ncbi:cold-shock protein [Pedobacter montanisoli]|uniref:Cold shock domain-containing protein n=1 Tax=Pedobacter montanisoli TaxID=2923277 RepID=A0ABS9ZWM8_9SPHI|nr:cold shock domain-containing protein [Pedobacter montanisoli]MCJ0742712.1 cold shock domain-containing protein [Pedobacter montanisoli]
MSESFAKKEKTKKKAKKKQDKALKMMNRKSSNTQSKTFEDMLAYVDENGNISDKPSTTSVKKEIDVNDIVLGAAVRTPEEVQLSGTVLFYDEIKGYGFIAVDRTEERIFVHNSALSESIKQKDKVLFEKEKTPRGFSAVMVKKVK